MLRCELRFAIEVVFFESAAGAWGNDGLLLRPKVHGGKLYFIYLRNESISSFSSRSKQFKDEVAATKPTSWQFVEKICDESSGG